MTESFFKMLVGSQAPCTWFRRLINVSMTDEFYLFSIFRGPTKTLILFFFFTDTAFHRALSLSQTTISDSSRLCFTPSNGSILSTFSRSVALRSTAHLGSSSYVLTSGLDYLLLHRVCCFRYFCHRRVTSFSSSIVAINPHKSFETRTS